LVRIYRSSALLVSVRTVFLTLAALVLCCRPGRKEKHQGRYRQSDEANRKISDPLFHPVCSPFLSNIHNYVGGLFMSGERMPASPVHASLILLCWHLQKFRYAAILSATGLMWTYSDSTDSVPPKVNRSRTRASRTLTGSERFFSANAKLKLYAGTWPRRKSLISF